MYVCGRCKARKYDHHKRRDGMNVCQPCARAIDEDGIEHKKTRTAVKVRHASDGAVIQVGKKQKDQGTIKVQAHGNSRFHNTAAQVAQSFQDKIDHALKMKPVRHIDPATVECKQLEGIELKRAIARRKIQRHYNANDFFRTMGHKAKRFPLTEAECDAVIKAANRMESGLKK